MKIQVSIHNENEIQRYYQGDTLHCKVNLLDSKPGYLFHIDTMTQNRISESFFHQNHFDSRFGRTLKNKGFYRFFMF